MPNLKIESNGYYSADRLYQWDRNQYLYIYGVSITKPVIHFSNKSMVMSIVRQPTVNKSGVISVMIPNSLLQKNEPIYVYVCRNEGDALKTYHKFEIVVNSRAKPADYTIELDDGEVYSFVNLEQEFNEIVGDFLELSKEVDDRINAQNNTLNNWVNRTNNIENEFTEVKNGVETTNNKLNDLITLLSGEVVWTNPDPSADFGATTLNLDLTAYKTFKVTFESPANMSIISFIMTKGKKYQSSVGFTSFWSRTCTISDTSIVFDRGTVGGSNSDSVMKPLEVVAYKY